MSPTPDSGAPNQPVRPPLRPPIPELPDFANIKIFALGAVWAIIGGLGLAGALIVDSLIAWKGYDSPVDWHQVERMAVGGALASATAYWRKYKALLEPSPLQPLEPGVPER